MNESLKLGVFLAAVSAIAAFSLSLTYILTADKIAESRAAELKMALQTVIPQADKFDEKNENLFVALRGKNKIGLCFKVFSKGYAGAITLLVGIDSEGKVAGVEILKMSETPGLGLRAIKPVFLNQFKGKTSESKLKAKEDIVALTGATITSNAVASGVREALKEFTENKALLK